MALKVSNPNPVDEVIVPCTKNGANMPTAFRETARADSLPPLRSRRLQKKFSDKAYQIGETYDLYHSYLFDLDGPH